MPRLLLAFLVALGVVLAGWAVAQEPGKSGPAKPDEKEEPPLRLKKRNDPEPKGEPKPEPGDRLRDPKKEDPDKEPGEKKPGEDTPPPPLPKESEAEVVARIITNMHRSEEKLEKRELDEGILQTQADVLKDLDSLIALGEKQQQQQQQQQNNAGGGSSRSQDRQQPRGGSKPQQGSQQAGGNKPMGGNRPSSGSKPRGERRASGSRPGQAKSGGRRTSHTALAQAKPQSNPGGGGANPGGGGVGETGPKDPNADQYKDTWGHLLASLRPEMNAYSNPRPFMPRYDDLIKRYYRTIAENGRK
jgi:hypothetical protein